MIRNTQHGFVVGKSCLTNLLEFLNYITDEADKGHSLNIAYLDFNKAFDKVSHNGLVIQLKRHGISDDIINWIQAWLYQRKQRVILNGAKSQWEYVTSGVPQGSVLGPLLFSIFVNNIENGIKSKVFKFADDIKLVSKVDPCSQNSMQDDLNMLVRWANAWQMSFNYSKCKVLGLGKHHKESFFQMDGRPLVNVKEERDLGVLLCSDLKWGRQCREATKRASRMLGLINRNVIYKSKYVIKKLYCAYVRPHLEYCIQTWSPFYKQDKELLEKVQRRATKMVNGFKNLEYEERLKRLGLKTLGYRRNRADMIEVFKILKGIDNIDAENMFKISENGITRGHKYKLQKQKFRTRAREHFFSQRVINSWNRLPPSLVEKSSLLAFKKNFDILNSSQL